MPLVYIEAILFSDIFFYSKDDGSIPGALPTALWADESFLNWIGVASLRDHLHVRFLDPSTLCSTDSQYHFYGFDCLVNLGTRGNDT